MQRGLEGASGKNRVAPLPYGSPLDKGRYMDSKSGGEDGNNGSHAAYGVEPYQKCTFEAKRVTTTPLVILGLRLSSVRYSDLRKRNIRPIQSAA